MKIKSKNINVKVMDNHLVVFYKNEILFKVSNNINNAINLLKLVNR